MTDLLFADTNLLIYAMDPAEPAKRAKASEVLLACTDRGTLVTSPQTLNECYRVLVERRRLVSPGDARAFVRAWSTTCRAPLDWSTIERAWRVADRHPYAWWDCLMLASALGASCTAFLTEDLTDGDDIDGMLIVNPFTTDITSYLQQN
jgi:predicted nucleic acid-binding protein